MAASPQGQREGNYGSVAFQIRTLRYSLRRVSPLDSVNWGLITQRSVVQIHPPQPNLSSAMTITWIGSREAQGSSAYCLFAPSLPLVGGYVSEPISLN